MLIDLFNEATVSHSEVGGKGYNLHLLNKANLPVPRAFALRSSKDGAIDVSALSSYLHDVAIEAPDTLYAVRSSGVGEDSKDASWAGIFDSYLFVKPSEIAHYAQKVMDSVQSKRYGEYSRANNVTIGAMAVIIQEMVDAEYAGVAFSVNPTENDNRIALIEVVKGVGESLVSSQKTPATLRVNKLTGTVRLQQQGHDNLGTELLTALSDKIIPYVVKIEDLYNMPMDIEWAICDHEVYILQARPITT